MSFGWSAGDLVAGVRLLLNVATALKEVDGASTQYRQSVSYLLDVANTLQQLKDSKVNGDDVTITDLLQSILRFRERLQHIFEEQLGRDSQSDWWVKLRKSPRKIHYGLVVHKEVHELRRQIDIPLKSIMIKLGLENYQLSRQLHQVGVDTQISVSDIQTSIEDLSAEMAAKAPTHQFTRVTEWLAPVALDDIHDRLLSTLAPGSCEWILQRDMFLNWRDAPKKTERYPLLWITGGVGCGKSHLASKVIQNLQSIKGKMLSFFYCDAQDNRRQRAIDILRTWSWQLIRQDPSCVADVASVKDSQQLVTERALENDILWVILTRNDSTFVVLDAFDECEMEDQIKLHGILARISKSARVLVFSRPLRAGFRDLKKQISLDGLVHLEVNESDTRADIDQYIKDEVDELIMEDETIAAETVSTLQSMANGMFLWVALILEALRRPRFTDFELLESLRHVPEDLDSLYTRILDDLSSHSRGRSMTRELLQLLLFTRRPLSIREIGSAMGVNPGEKNIKAKALMSDERLEDAITHYCGSLVTIQRGTEGHTTVTFVHSSLKEFLLSDTFRLLDQPTFRFEPGEAHDAIAQICLTYLCYDNMKPLPYDIAGQRILQWDEICQIFAAYMKQYPLLEYSTLHWWWHVLRSSSSSLTIATLRKLSNSPRKTIRWLQILLECHRSGEDTYVGECFDQIPSIKDMLPEPEHEMFSRWYQPFERQPQSRRVMSSGVHYLLVNDQVHFMPEIHVASFFGFSDLLQQSLDTGVDANCPNYAGYNALYLATLGDSHECMRILIKHGADFAFPASDPLRLTVGRLWWGISHPAPYTAAMILLEAGADPCRGNGADFRALCSGSFAEDPFSVSLATQMLKQGAEKVINECGPFTPLQYSARCKNLELVKLLLAHGARVNDGCQHGEKETALLQACDVTTPQNTLEVVQVLLEAGASVDVRRSDGRSPLHLAVRHVLDLGRLLLQAGGQIDAQSNDGYTPLHDAVVENNPEMIKLLIANSACLQLRNIAQQTPLALAIEYQNCEAIDLLQQAGAITTEISLAPKFSGLYHPRQPRDIFEAFQILQNCGRSQETPLARHIIVSILDHARYWVLSRETRNDEITVADKDCKHRTPYLTSSPFCTPSTSIREIQVTIWSHDQGWSKYPEHHGTMSFSRAWFDISVEGPLRQGDLINEEQRCIITNIHASSVYRRHQVTYRNPRSSFISGSMCDNGNWIQHLENGDRISIIPMAQSPGWINYVREASIEIYTSCLL